MKIQEKDWLLKVKEVKTSINNPEAPDYFVLERVASEIFGEDAFSVGFNNKKFLAKNDGIFKDYIFGDFSKKYDLTPGVEVICSNESRVTSVLQCSSLYKASFIITPTILFGDDLIVSLIVAEGIVKIYGILYKINKVHTVMDMVEDYQNFIENLPKSPDTYNVNFVGKGKMGLVSSNYEVKKKNEIHIDELYNEDIPDERILKFIKSEGSGIIILHGMPGCGKSTYIRSILDRCSNEDNVQYYILTLDQFGDMDNVRKLLLQHCNENAVYIVEDCEELLKPRTQKGSTAALSDLLNFADGIFGDIANSKFLLTFNTNLSDVDEAVLRKGRLKVKYEFKPLIGKRLKKLAEKVGFEPTKSQIQEGMALSDIFNIDEESYKNTRKKIGFGS